MLSSRVVVKIPKMDIPVVEVNTQLIELNRLIPHEEIVEGRLKDLVNSITKVQAVDMPLVVAPIPSTDKFLIVDGHHRWAALIELKCRYAPCVVIDYFDERVVLKTWYPAIDGSLKPILDALRNSGVEYYRYECSLIYSLDEILANTAFLVRGYGGDCIAIGKTINDQKIVSKILSDLNLRGEFNLIYYGELEDAINDLMNREVTYVFLRKTISKMEVIETVMHGDVYAPKTTRHILPFIPAKNYIKLDKLC